jgi:hypothetical protein
MRFKQPPVWVVCVAGILIATLIVNHNQATAKPASFKPTAGTVVAYYDNDYQRYAVAQLIKRNQIQEWYCLWSLWTKESNWRPSSHNKASGARGIAQLLPRTYRNLNMKHSLNGYRQIDAGLIYIDHHWGGSICRAYASELARGYY